MIVILLGGLDCEVSKLFIVFSPPPPLTSQLAVAMKLPVT